jgi:hypothetical protein
MSNDAYLCLSHELPHFYLTRNLRYHTTPVAYCTPSGRSALMLPLGQGVRLPVDVLEFTGTAGRYLQLASVSRGWRSLYAQLCPDHRSTFAAAVTALPLLAWARDLGLPWTARTAARIAVGGHLEVLQQARADGCPWDNMVCNAAAAFNHLELLQWAHGNGCPWSERTCEHVALGGHLEVLKWLTPMPVRGLP